MIFGLLVNELMLGLCLGYLMNKEYVLEYVLITIGLILDGISLTVYIYVYYRMGENSVKFKDLGIEM
jgi:hypothetical protein